MWRKYPTNILQDLLTFPNDIRYLYSRLQNELKTKIMDYSEFYITLLAIWLGVVAIICRLDSVWVADDRAIIAEIKRRNEVLKASRNAK